MIIGGYGNFGGYSARRLSANAAIQLVLSGRSDAKAEAFAKTLTDAVHPVLTHAFDFRTGIAAALGAMRPDIVLHTSGPFQGQDYGVAEACIAAGVHYLDLADGRDYVVNITTLDAAAKKAGVSVISGASSVPALTSAIIDHALSKFEALHTVEYGIAIAQNSARGLATTKAVLGYAGEAFSTIVDGKTSQIYGWQDYHFRTLTGAGRRGFGNCNIPDLSLFPSRYLSLKTLRFYAGLEVPLVQRGLWLLSWLRRWKLLPSIALFSRPLLSASNLFDRFGSGTSALFMVLTGGSSGGSDRSTEKTIRFDLLARRGDGVHIPCIPAILIAEKLVAQTSDARQIPLGAQPCIGLLRLDEVLTALEPLDITCTFTE